MTQSHSRRRPPQLAVALGALLTAAGCAGAPAPAPEARALPANLDRGVGQLLRYCATLRDGGDLVTAVGMCERAHQLAPKAPEPLLLLGEILTEMGELASAAEVYRTVLAQNPDHVEARYALAKTYIATTQYDAAIAELQAGLRTAPTDPRLFNALGIANGLTGRHAAAQEAFEAGLTIAPHHVGLRNNMGLSLALSGHGAEGTALLHDLAEGSASPVSRTNLQFARSLAAGAPEQSAQAPAPAAAETAAPAASDAPVLLAQASAEDHEAAPAPAATLPQAAPNSAASSSIDEPIMLTAALGGSPGSDASEGFEQPSPNSDAASSNPLRMQTARAALPDAMPVADIAATVDLGEYLPVDIDIGLPSMAEDTLAAPSAGGRAAYEVQLASYQSSDDATAGWDVLRAAAGDLLAGLEPVVRRADLGPGKGVFYRLRATALTKGEAETLCQGLRGRGLACLMVRQDSTLAETAPASGAAGL